MVGHTLLKGKRRGVKYVVITVCIGGEMGTASLFEVACLYLKLPDSLIMTIN